MRVVPLGTAVMLSSVALVGASATPPLREAVPSVPLAIDLPVVRQHTYRMAGKVRMLLIWVGRDDVGSGVITWKGSGSDRAYELLIGSDPAKAPGHLNKWGYLVEEIRGGDTSVVGVISQGEERLSDVKKGLASQQGRRPFDTVRGRVGGDEAHARVGTLYAPSGVTYHDASTVLKTLLDDRSKPIRRLDRPDGVRAGFLTSLTELVRASIASSTGSPATRAVRYVHGDRLYELRLVESVRLRRFHQDEHIFENVIRARFETGQVETRSPTRFELVYGASGTFAGIPIRVSYQPKWWLQVDLFLQT
jgi:hypothetical protein